MTICEDKNCGEEAKRRFRCWHCGLLVCPWCWHHLHRCEPGHRRADCSDLARLHRARAAKHGAEYLKRLRARTLFLNERGATS